MKRTHPFWTRAQDFATVGMHEANMSARQIGIAISKSRCAVLGRIWRMQNNGIYDRILTDLGIESPTNPPPIPRPTVEIPNDRICAKPDCGATRQPGKPFCAAHTELPARTRADMMVGARVGVSSLGEF